MVRIKFFLPIYFLSFLFLPFCQAQKPVPPREDLLMDFGWKFALGNYSDAHKDFDFGTSYFSYLAKTGYGSGVESEKFDDRNWRPINLPHDWAVQQPFSPLGSFSHGSKAIGIHFPEASIGWYRKKFYIPRADLGKHISIRFDGVFRNSIVWINGHYLGNEPSGYASFEYNLSEYLHYGGENSIAVRVDAHMEEGWFYEGAGIYRHVWLTKKNTLHIPTYGTFIRSTSKDNLGKVDIETRVENSDSRSRNFVLRQVILDTLGQKVGQTISTPLSLKPFQEIALNQEIYISNPSLWSTERPYLYTVNSFLEENGIAIDNYRTVIGIRNIHFDAVNGFTLNGKSLKIKGTNNHQDHAGLGTALPDAVQDYRIQSLKLMGANAYRCSHNPPTPELLDACDRLGMLVIDENRLMGTSSTQIGDLKRMIVRDRNHPSIISWSIGNEEWGIENTITGERIAQTMQSYAKSLDSSRYITAAFSGGMGNGISKVIDVLGYNYIMNKNTDKHHQEFPGQPSWGTEEGSTVASRGIYKNNEETHQRAAYDEPQNESSLSIEQGWTHYATRPYLAGMFVWTGFDYRGEPTPFNYPSIESYFGMLDACGFPKDDYYYLKSWWSSTPVLHILPHWNFPGQEGKSIPVWVYSNCEEVELFLNKISLGKKTMPINSHLVWEVPYAPGIVEARGYKAGQISLVDMVKTSDTAYSLNLSKNRNEMLANQEDVIMVQVSVEDIHKIWVPTASNEVSFSLLGPGKIIGVGNGNQTSLEPDQYQDSLLNLSLTPLVEKYVPELNSIAEMGIHWEDSPWNKAFREVRDEDFAKKVKAVAYRTQFSAPNNFQNGIARFFYKSLGKIQSLYLNGVKIGSNLSYSDTGSTLYLENSMIHTGLNSIIIVTEPLIRKNRWDEVNTDPGLVQFSFPAQAWKRKLFSGLAQVIIQSTGEPGSLILKATSPGLKEKTLLIRSKRAELRPKITED